MLELLHPKCNHLIRTVVDGSICISNHMFGRAIWDSPSTLLKIWKF